MKKLLLTLALLAAALPAAAEKPNIIFIFIDDLGWKDIGCYGNDVTETPRIDQLAKEGMRFTDFYASGAVCSPTRCAVQSGQNQARIGITAHIPGHWRPFERVITPLTTMALPLDTITVAETLKQSGYSTGYVGKWHLGSGPEFAPDKQGYDYTAEINGAHLPTKFRVRGTETRQPEKDQFRTEFEGQLCADFIRNNKDKPFFLFLSPFTVHIPLAAESGLVEKYQKKNKEMGRELPNPIYSAMIEQCDDMVGEIVDAVEKEGLSEKTMIIFTSDNGGLYRRYDYQPHADDDVATQAPLKGEKGSLHEGGIRVPMIVKYPPLVKAGTTCPEPTISHDFYPTFVDLAGGKLPETQTIDGFSLKPLLADGSAKLERAALHWHYPHYHHDRPASAIRERDWKMIEYLDGTGDVEIYHLAQDIGESKNLLEERKGKIADLKKKLNSWRHRVSARMPIPNPSHDPKRAAEWWSMRNGKPVDSAARTRFPPTEKDL